MEIAQMSVFEIVVIFETVTGETIHANVGKPDGADS
jgi:hypothetical protein